MYFTAVLAVLVSACSAQYIISPYSAYTPYSAYSPYNSPYFGYRAAAPVVTPVAHPVDLPVSTRYHAQDELGQFTFGHSSPFESRTESKAFDGTVHGSYSYVDPNGKVNKVVYRAGADRGFEILGANNLPVAPETPVAPVVALPEPVKETEEVRAARVEFERKFEEAKVGTVVALPEPVKETEEVRVARVEFEKKFEEAKIAAAAAPKSRRRRDVITPLTTLPILPIARSIYSGIPIPLEASYPYVHAISPLPVAKTILKTAELKPLEETKVPASTKLAEIKETEKEIIHPITYSTLPYSTFPYSYSTYPYSALPYSSLATPAYPYGIYPYRR